MIRPLDMQVAFNALPDHGARVTQELAATQYRQVQEYGDSRTENLNRPAKVVETASTYAPVFQNVERGDQNNPVRQQELRERVRRRIEDRENGSDEKPLTYGPASLLDMAPRRKYSDEGAGQLLDWTA